MWSGVRARTHTHAHIHTHTRRSGCQSGGCIACAASYNHITDYELACYYYTTGEAVARTAVA